MMPRRRAALRVAGVSGVRRMIVRLRLFVAVALLLGGVASCGGPPDDGPGAPGDPAPPPAAPPAAATPPPSRPRPPPPPWPNAMDLGSFTVCLRVKDLAASRAFYEKLGFAQVAGDVAQRYIVVRNGTTKIGLFEAYIERATLTFNPGWGPDGQSLADFTDVRDLQKAVEARGLKPSPAADPATTGPAHFILADPDGNPIYVDQHVPRPSR